MWLNAQSSSSPSSSYTSWRTSWLVLVLLLLLGLSAICQATEPELHPPQQQQQQQPPQQHQYTPPQQQPQQPHQQQQHTKSVEWEQVLSGIAQSRQDMQNLQMSLNGVTGKVDTLSQSVNQASRDSSQKIGANQDKLSLLGTANENVLSTLAAVRDSLATSFDKSGKNQKEILEAVAKLSTIVNGLSKNQNDQTDTKEKVLLEKLGAVESQIKKMNKQLATIVENQLAALNSTFSETVTDTLSEWSSAVKNLSVDMAGVVHRHGGQYWEVGKQKGIEVGTHLYQHGTTLTDSFRSILATKYKDFGAPSQYTELLASITLVTVASTVAFLSLFFCWSICKCMCCRGSRKSKSGKTKKEEKKQKPTKKKEKKTKGEEEDEDDEDDED